MKRQLLIWGHYLKKFGVNRGRRGKLSGSEWTVSRVIEMLEITELVSKDDYKILSELRKKRNDLIHEGEVIHKDEATKCFEYAFQSLIQRTKAYDQYSQDALTRFIIQRYDPNDIPF